LSYFALCYLLFAPFYLIFEKYIGIVGYPLAGVSVRISYFDFCRPCKKCSHCLAQQWEAFCVLLPDGPPPSLGSVLFLYKVWHWASEAKIKIYHN